MVIEKELNYDGTIVSIKYFGLKKTKNIDMNHDKELINKIFGNCQFCDVLTITKLLRTILKNYNERYLTVKITYENDLTYVKYYKGKLDNYTNKLSLDHSNKDSAIIGSNYSSNNDINFFIKNSSLDMKDNKLKNQIYNYIEEETNYISNLKNIENIELCEEDEKLLKKYK